MAKRARGKTAKFKVLSAPTVFQLEAALFGGELDPRTHLGSKCMVIFETSGGSFAVSPRELHVKFRQFGRTQRHYYRLVGSGGKLTHKQDLSPHTDHWMLITVDFSIQRKWGTLSVAER